MTSNVFELRIERNGKRVNLVIYQLLSATRGTKAMRLGSMAYDKLPAVADLVLPALRRGGNKVTDLSRSQAKTFGLAEKDGLMLGLLFLAIAPLSRLDRIDAIAKEIDSMSAEELTYWHGLCAKNQRAKKALRILLSP